MVKNNIVTQLTGFKDRLMAPYKGLKVSWFDSWHPALDEALQVLPEDKTYPHELYRLIIQNSGSAKKKTALVTYGGTPVAVVGLRQKGQHSWEPVTQWIIPGIVFSSKPEYIPAVLDALRVEVWVAWWRMENVLPISKLMRYLEATPTYRMRCSEDIEQYWRDNGYFKTIRRMRNRCKDFKPKINSPGSAEWTIKNWEAKWRLNPELIDPSLTDRILAAKYLEERKLHYCLTLFDQDTLIGGATITAHKKDLVAGVLYYEPNYRRYGVGDRLIDLCFNFAIENGFETFDIGGGHEYKKRWARQDGERWWFNICPEPLYRIKQASRWARRVIKKNSEDIPTQSGVV